jgi:hypothetical protein
MSASGRVRISTGLRCAASRPARSVPVAVARPARRARERVPPVRLGHRHLYRLMMDRRLPRDQLPDGLEARAGSVIVAAVGGDPDRARAAFPVAHAMVSLEVNDRFPPGADIDAAWRSGIDALRPDTTPHPQRPPNPADDWSACTSIATRPSTETSGAGDGRASRDHLPAGGRRRLLAGGLEPRRFRVETTTPGTVGRSFR